MQGGFHFLILAFVCLAGLNVLAENIKPVITEEASEDLEVISVEGE